MNYGEWMKKAYLYLDSKVGIGQKFECKSLFPGHEWDQLSSGERKSFGRYFSNEVREGRVKGVARSDQAKNRHNVYIKEA